MTFPFSAQGEIVLTAADGELPSADIAIGRLDAALSAQRPDDITRTPSSIRFQYNPLVRTLGARFEPGWHRWDPDRIQLYSGRIEVEQNAGELRLTYDVNYLTAVVVLAVPIVLLLIVRPPLGLGLAALAFIALFGLALIASAISRFRGFVRRAVLGQVKSGPDES
jgi:hypothetical protein